MEGLTYSWASYDLHERVWTEFTHSWEGVRTVRVPVSVSVNCFLFHYAAEDKHVCGDPPPPPLRPFTSFPSTILSKPPEIFCSICHWGSSTSNPRCCIKYSCRFPTGWQAPLNSVQEHVADLRGWFMNIQMCNMHAGSAVSLPKSIIQSIKCNEWGSWAHILYLWDLRFTSCLVMR